MNNIIKRIYSRTNANGGFPSNYQLHLIYVVINTWTLTASIMCNYLDTKYTLPLWNVSVYLHQSLQFLVRFVILPRKWVNFSAKSPHRFIDSVIRIPSCRSFLLQKSTEKRLGTAHFLNKIEIIFWMGCHTCHVEFNNFKPQPSSLSSLTFHFYFKAAAVRGSSVIYIAIQVQVLHFIVTFVKLIHSFTPVYQTLKWQLREEAFKFNFAEFWRKFLVCPFLRGTKCCVWHQLHGERHK